MNMKKRGRPVGSSPNVGDDSILKATAGKLVRVQVKTATEAFKQILGEHDEAGLRRLQRKWAVQAEPLIEEAQKPFWSKHWEKDEENLKQNNPEVYQLVRALADSDGGKAMLLEKGSTDKPVHIMSLGVVKLRDLLNSTTMQGVRKAKEEFAVCFAKWSNFGSTPNSEFLRTFAELCLAKADELDAEKAGKENGGKL